jgi:hypothetical protein
MLVHASRPLFAWSELEGSPSLQTIRAVLSSLPDQALLDGLRQARGCGRNDYPVRVLWGVVVLSVLRRHVFLNDCLAELHRDPTLCGILGTCEVVDIPKPHNLSRFLDLLGQAEVQRGAGLWAGGAPEVRGGPATVPADRAGDQAVRAAVRGADGGGAGQRAAEDLLGVDDGNVAGARRFHAHVGVVMIAHVALAKWLAKQPRWEGRLSAVSLSPIAQALARLDEEHAPTRELAADAA